MNPTNNQEALGYLRGLLDGLDYIHRSGYLHRDLTKKNIFFGKDNNIKIGDFGLAKKLVGSEDYMYCSQSPHPTSIRIGLHRAPELLENEPYTRKSDMYGLGIIFLEMLLSPLDTAHERINIIEQIKKGQYPGEWENKFETAVLKKLLAESPDDRPYADELIQFIDH
ncbi:uncharacterized protein LOC141689319 [Apium graveolens]|uniref:uncharacterized protein LOC141689319 n=1 Tax=Apium graveolens TaxID=4045 RepID=UPI003D7AEA65